MRSAFWWGGATVVYLACAGSSASAQNTSFHALTVKRWDGPSPAFLSDGRADACLNDASTLLLTDSDGAGNADVYCNANLTRSGSVGTFTVTDGYLDTYSEWDQVAHYTAGFVKLVKTITYCGGKVGSFAGCTGAGDRNHIVLSQGAIDSSVCGKYIAHEFGHSVGLADDTSNTGNNVMRQGAYAYSYITSPQCTVFRNDFIDHDGPGGSLALRAAGALADEGSADGYAFSELDGGLGSHVPADVIGRYGKKDVHALLKRLKDPHWPRAGVFQLLGLIGAESDKTSKVLIDFIDVGSKDLDALASAVISLGYLGFHGNQDALEYLMGLSNDARPEFASWAVSALGVSGAPEAEDYLHSLFPGVQADQRHGCRSPELVEIALDANRKVRERGLKGYYDDPR